MGKLVFLGAAGTVTGSKYLLETSGKRYLIDGGLFQGTREWKQFNWDPFFVPPETIDAILLTHGHIDHTGYLPRLVQQGYRGPIYATPATCALLKILLPDSAQIQEQDADYANRKGYSRHKPALPLYTVGDANATLRLLQPIEFHTMLTLHGIRAFWYPMGHILGSASIEVQLEASGNRVLFSGDIGRYEDPIMRPPTEFHSADFVLMESTYGDCLHATTPVEETLRSMLEYILQHQGVLLIPAFAGGGRTQLVLYYIRKLQESGEIPPIPVYVDSPMATDATALYCNYGQDLNMETSAGGEHENQLPLYCYHTHFVQDASQSRALNTRSGPMIIISASGMCTGGRILHHLKWRLPKPENAVLFVGYQAEGTRGRQLVEGAPQITIHGEEVPVRARIEMTTALSAHADQADLLRWLRAFQQPPRTVYLVHGETNARMHLREQIGQALGWSVALPEYREQVEEI